MLVNGKWTASWDPVQAKDENGRFVRQASSFRNWITPDGSPGPTGEGGFMAEAGRYHLYVALICPWASRTLMVRKLKGLEAIISVTVAEPFLGDEGWRFGSYPGADEDSLLGARFVHEIYTRAEPGYTGRATVPVLWDKERATIVNNESADIMRMLGNAFDHLAGPTIDLYPPELRQDIDRLAAELYDKLNNGVYKAGFASSQSAYDEAVGEVFAMLDALEARMADGRSFLMGELLTEVDIRLFVTLVRFDAAYHGLFKCNIRPIADYRHLASLLDRIYALPGIAETVNIDHIKQGYYSIKALNPSGIVPAGPSLRFGAAT